MSTQFRVFAFLFVLVAAGGNGFITSPPPIDAHENEVLKVEEQMESLQRANDPARISLWADDFVYIGHDGEIDDKAGLARSVSANEMHIDSLQVTERKIRIYDDLAVVTAKEDIRASLHGKASTGISDRYTRVWVQRAGTWQAVSFQATKIANGPVPLAGFEACSAPDSPVRPGSIEETILRLEEEHSQASRSGESSRGTGWLADDYIGINGNGVLSEKPAVVQLYRPGSLKYRIEKYAGRRIRVYGNAAILTATWCVRQRRDEQEEATFANRITRIWARRNGTWEVVSWQGTPVPPSPTLKPQSADRNP